MPSMEKYDLLYSLYEDYDTKTLRDYRDFVDLFPPVDSRVALEHWEDINRELERRKESIREDFSYGETFAEMASTATREQTFNALDLYNKYKSEVNVLVLDVDETLRSASNTDNEIPRETLSLLTKINESGIPLIICTGQTLENVKGFMIQGLGNELVHSGDMSIVYEAGTGVFTPGHGERTKELLYENLDDSVRELFNRIRSSVLSEAPSELSRKLHLQGNEFNVTLKPNFETGSRKAEETIDSALIHLLDLLGSITVDRVENYPSNTSEDDKQNGESREVNEDREGSEMARYYYSKRDPEIRKVLESEGEIPDLDYIPDATKEVFDRIDVGYYRGDAAEITSKELNKVEGVKVAFDVLGVDDPFALVMGDSKSDLRVMKYVEENNCGISAAPEHSSADVLDHVMSTDDLVFPRGNSPEILRTVYALNLLAQID